MPGAGPYHVFRLASLEYEQGDLVEVVQQKIENQSWTAVTLHVGAQNLRIISVCFLLFW